ncbi:MAG: DUF4037 domain-containing protein [Acutalibacteraceae bacterium]
MNGLELAKKYFEEYGRPMLENEFSDILPYLAVAFTGSGSEHYGFDDELSRDHDFEPGFCIFIPGEDIIDSRKEFRLERAYAKLPNEYLGVKRQRISPVGGNRHGVFRTFSYFESAVGSGDGNLSLNAWLQIPDYALAEAVNGEVFFDNYGELTRIRNNILSMPEDIRLKRIAGNILIMAQSGQYNFLRCLRHGEPEAAQLACNEFVSAAMKTVFLLNNKYLPYYKWSFRALRETPGAQALAEKLGFLLSGNNSNSEEAEKKYNTIEEISAEIINVLQEKNLTKAVCGDLEKHAYSVNDKIKDGNIRNMHILSAV